jgi:hypothetical protein
MCVARVSVLAVASSTLAFGAQAYSLPLIESPTEAAAAFALAVPSAASMLLLLGVIGGLGAISCQHRAATA